MLRISFRKLCKESFAFFIKNLDITLLYVFVLPVSMLVGRSTLSNDIQILRPLYGFIETMSPAVYVVVFTLINIYLIVAILTITSVILSRWQHKKQTAPDALRHIIRQLFNKGAWWYLLLATVTFWGSQALLSPMLDPQQLVLRIVISVALGVVGALSMYFMPIIADNYHSFNHTVLTSWSYFKRSILFILKALLLSSLLGGLIAAIGISLGLGIKYMVGGGTNLDIAPGVMMISTLLITTLMSYIYAIAILKVYLLLKAND